MESMGYHDQRNKGSIFVRMMWDGKFLETYQEC